MILILLTMVLGTGLNMTVSSYRKIIAQSEVDLMLSTTMDALADDLRFAQYVEAYPDHDHPYNSAATDNYESIAPFTYISDSFAGKIHLKLDGVTGQIMACKATLNTTTGEYVDEDPKLFLSTGAYGAGEPGKERAYRVSVMEITPDTYIDPYTNTKTGIFKIHLKVYAVADESITAEGEITIRCLNDDLAFIAEENGGT